MSRIEFIVKVILDLLWYEWIWFVMKKWPRYIPSVQLAFHYLMAINFFFLILGSGIETFVNLYFMTLWYFVIFPDRLRNELKLKEQGPVA